MGTADWCRQGGSAGGLESSIKVGSVGRQVGGWLAACAGTCSCKRECHGQSLQHTDSPLAHNLGYGAAILPLLWNNEQAHHQVVLGTGWLTKLLHSSTPASQRYWRTCTDAPSEWSAAVEVHDRLAARLGALKHLTIRTSPACMQTLLQQQDG
jgi:hypothetical protein